MADRPSGTAAGAPANAGAGTISGNRGLMIEEPLSFEQGMPGRTAVDLPAVPPHKDHLGGLRRRNEIGLPGM
ncbi:MAG: aminomethyl-transferring glycine dehydrogenase subunit GcvPB, partial [Dongia sp.]